MSRVPGASITVRNVQPGQIRVVATSDTGQYRFPNLQVGQYELTVELAGSGSYQQSRLNLTLNQEATIDVTLQPAGLAESVQVTADAPLLNTTSAEVGVRFDTRRIAELPVINSRDIFSLALQAAGVSQPGRGQTAPMLVALTGLDREHVPAFDSSFDRHLLKPVSTPELTDILNEPSRATADGRPVESLRLFGGTVSCVRRHQLDQHLWRRKCQRVVVQRPRQRTA